MKNSIDKALERVEMNCFIDIHTHLLPCMDDGSKSPEESLQMLSALHEQGVCAVVATPHFYPERENPADFFARREESAKVLVEAIENSKKQLPKVCLGAEVAYFSGICKSDCVSRLCFEGTNTILVEMPFDKWSNSVVDDIVKLKRVVGLDVVIAHIERYAKYQSREVLEILSSCGIVFQVNCEAFSKLSDRNCVFRIMKSGNKILLGTDCHDNALRAPNVSVAMQSIMKKFGPSALETLATDGEKALEGAIYLNS